MTVSIIESHSGILSSGGADASVTITSPLTPADRVVVVVCKRATQGTPSVSGLGATWVADVAQTATADQYIVSASGVTGGGSLTINSGSFSYSSAYAVYVLRSDTGGSVFLADAESAAVGFVNPAFLSVPAVTTAAGSLAVATAYSFTSTIAFPGPTSTPASGWTTSILDGTSGAIVYRAFPANGVASLTVEKSNGGNSSGLAAAVAVYHDGSTPSTPIEYWGSLA